MESRRTGCELNGVELVHWNPRRHHLPRPLGRVRYGQRTGNFGDLLGPAIVKRIILGPNVRAPGESAVTGGRHRMLSVGSIMHLARDGDIVWGTGINGKNLDIPLRARYLDVRAVRGPRTAEILRQNSLSTSHVFGDPAILLPKIAPELLAVRPTQGSLALIPNLHDLPTWKKTGVDVISPLGDPWKVIHAILKSERVVTSSLHGLIVAEVFGRPVVLVKPRVETMFKYDDYREGTGRPVLEAAESLTEALLRIETEAAASIDPEVPERLLAAFPQDVWAGTSS